MNVDQNNRQSRSDAAIGGAGSRTPRPALDPRSPVLAQPFKGLVETGVITRITVEFTPMGCEVKGKASKMLADVEKSGLNTTDFFPVGLLLSIAEKGGLTTRPGKKGKAASTATLQKPAKSLVDSDIDGSLSPAALQQRINEIARACGGGPLVGRVRSAGEFKGAETISYRSWWDNASAHQKVLSLSEGKRRAAFTPEMESRLDGLQCPFRGTLEFVVSKDDEGEDE